MAHLPQVKCSLKLWLLFFLLEMSQGCVQMVVVIGQLYCLLLFFRGGVVVLLQELDVVVVLDDLSVVPELLDLLLSNSFCDN
jgi:hypothetical protein